MACEYHDRETEREEWHAERDKLTRMLCEACTHIDETVHGRWQTSISPELTEWWNEHQRKDRERQNRETFAASKAETRKQALAKLNQAELEALDITQAERDAAKRR